MDWYSFTKENELIRHRSIFPVKSVCDFYSEKDGVPISYICTSALGNQNFAVDIFYRVTPHPEFNNRYFGLYFGPIGGNINITNADCVEDLGFSMVLGDKGWEYSQHRHDFHCVSGAGVAIDGGRAYTKMVGDFQSVKTQEFNIKEGVFCYAE